MTRQKNLFPKGRLRLLNASSKKHDPNKVYSISIEYSYNTSPIRRQTGVRCKFEDWNPKTQRLQASYGKNYQLMNNAMQKQLNDADARMQEYGERHNYRFNTEIVRALLYNKDMARKDEGKDFKAYCVDILSSEYNRNKIGYSRYNNGLSGMSIFQQFLITKGLGTYRKDSIYLGEITPEIVEQYIQWRKQVKHNCDETINHSLCPIIKACKRACEAGYISQHIYGRIAEMYISTSDISEKNLDDTKFDGKYLTHEQIQCLIQYYNNCSEPRRKEYIEMWLFAYHCSGLRLVDVATLQWSHVDLERNIITKILIKTKSRVRIPITAASLEILLKWKEKRGNSKFVFDLIPDSISLADKEELHRARNSADKCVNQSLTPVGLQLGFDFHLTFHRARHSFAIHALNSDIPINVVSQLMGHKDTSITERIYAQFLPDKLSANLQNFSGADLRII